MTFTPGPQPEPNSMDLVTEWNCEALIQQAKHCTEDAAAKDYLSALQEIRLLERNTETAKIHLVRMARDEGMTWKDIGDALRITKQSAHYQWSNP